MEAVERLTALVERTPSDWDIAAANLACAQGLPGAEDLDIGRHLDTLDAWAKCVDLETQRHYYRFIERPSEYENSQGYFCVLVMITVLQKDLGVAYNPARIHDPDFRDARDLFIHGMIAGNGGTCASMPVLYVSIGRRLGYPLTLVEAKGHLFARWDDPEGKRWLTPERFNIEGAGQGLSTYPDEHYHTWPVPMTPEDNASGIFLRSLTPREELALFLTNRGFCLWDNDRKREALEAYAAAHRLVPEDWRYEWLLGSSAARYEQERLALLEVTNRNRRLPGLGMHRDVPGEPSGHRLPRGSLVPAIAPLGTPQDSESAPPAEFERHLPPGTVAALRHMEEAKRLNELNRANQERMLAGPKCPRRPGF